MRLSTPSFHTKKKRKNDADSKNRKKISHSPSRKSHEAQGKQRRQQKDAGDEVRQASTRRCICAFQTSGCEGKQAGAPCRESEADRSNDKGETPHTRIYAAKSETGGSSKTACYKSSKPSRCENESKAGGV